MTSDKSDATKAMPIGTRIEGVTKDGIVTFPGLPEGAVVRAETTKAWGWNGDMCAVWGVAIVLGDSREEKERRARIIAAAMFPKAPARHPAQDYTPVLKELDHE